MRFPVVFSLAGLLLCTSGAWLGGVGWLAVWVGVAFLWLAVVYGLDRPQWLGKSAEGRMRPLTVALFFPYFGFTWTMWHLFHGITSEPACHEVAPGLWLGRRPIRVTLDPRVSLIVDCTGEFPAARRAGCTYALAPALDARAPAPPDLDRVVALAATWDGAVYVHCAAGHGRSALVAALVVLRRGLATDLNAAEQLLRSRRPAVRLHTPQRRAGDAALTRLRDGASAQAVLNG